jgi:hypothetical protein
MKLISIKDMRKKIHRILQSSSLINYKSMRVVQYFEERRKRYQRIIIYLNVNQMKFGRNKNN